MLQKSAITSVRTLAIHALIAILEHHHKAEAAIQHLGEHLAPRDRALLHELVLGVLRRFFSLEADVSRFLKQKPDITVRICLFIGAYQLRYMRIPTHAAVSECVESIKSFQPKASGMVNAILRKVANHEPPKKLKPYQRADIPKWIYTQWRDAWGEEVVQHFCQALQSPPPLCLAIMGVREVWLEQALQQGFEAVAGELSAYAVLLPTGTDVTSLPGFQEGAFSVMDQAAQTPIMALSIPQSGTILDICAAPGGKTSLLSQRFPTAKIFAIERQGKRIPRLQENLSRLKKANTHIIQGDALKLPFPDASVDAIILDAPCSASGILRRHPDAKFLHSENDVMALAQQQKQMLDEAMRTLKPKRALIYAVCSIHPKENASVLAGYPVLQQQRIFPSETHDGFFWAYLSK